MKKQEEKGQQANSQPDQPAFSAPAEKQPDAEQQKRKDRDSIGAWGRYR